MTVIADHAIHHLSQDQGYRLWGVYRRLPTQWAIQVDQYTRRGRNTETLSASIPLEEWAAAVAARPEAFADVLAALAAAWSARQAEVAA